MACPKFDRTNKKHFIIAASVAASVVIIIVVIVLVAVLVPRSGSNGSSSEGGNGTNTSSPSGSSSKGGTPGSGSVSGHGCGSSEHSIIVDSGSGTKIEANLSVTEEALQAGLDRHNELRKKHHSPPLKMSCVLNDDARKCLEYYETVRRADHSCPYKGGAGENIYSYKGFHESHIQSYEWHMEKATEEWYSEIKDYDWRTRASKNGKDIGHFTQVIWKRSEELGMGISKKGIARVMVVALYQPRGNRDGNFRENVLPE